MNIKLYLSQVVQFTTQFLVFYSYLSCRRYDIVTILIQKVDTIKLAHLLVGILYIFDMCTVYAFIKIYSDSDRIIYAAKTGNVTMYISYYFLTL